MTRPDPRTYVIEPLSSVIVRSGRPFDGQNGADSARLPPPSTLAGALRTAHAAGSGKALAPDLALISVAGPLLVKLDDAGTPLSLLLPKPADALYFSQPNQEHARLVAARPRPLAASEGMDLPDAALYPVQLTEAVSGKPARGPRWWALADLLAFRTSNKTPSVQTLAANGWSPPADDVRTHVAIDRSTHASAAGQLFQTAGISFLQDGQGVTLYGQAQLPNGRIGLVGRIDADAEVPTGVITLGGERRLAAIAPAPKNLWPECPKGWVDDVRRSKGLCLSVITPALFGAGWRPAWSLDPEGHPDGCEGLRLILRAAALERWQPHSGWDLAQGRPRAGRKLVPAGATYWFELANAANAPDAALRALWTASICDHPQDRRDGFGLVLPSPWSLPHSP